MWRLCCCRTAFQRHRNRIHQSRFLDDKLSAAILLAYAKYLEGYRSEAAPQRVYVDFTVVWEVGHGGAGDSAGCSGDAQWTWGALVQGLQCDETMVSICVMDSKARHIKRWWTAWVVAARCAILLRAGCSIPTIPRMRT